jgi:hypothetical protein
MQPSHPIEAIPPEVCELLAADRHTMQAVSRASYRAFNRRDVEFTPVVVVGGGRLAWRACVLAGRSGSPDWLSVAYDGPAHHSGRILGIASRVAASSDPVSPVCVRGEDGAVVCAILSVLRRATSVRVKYIRPVTVPLALGGLRCVTLEWMAYPPPAPQFPEGLEQLRLYCADVRALRLPTKLKFLELHRTAQLDAPHLVAQIASTPGLRGLVVSIDPSTGDTDWETPPAADLRCILDAALMLDELRTFGVSGARVFDESEPGRAAVAALAHLIPRLDKLVIASSGLASFDGLPLERLRVLDVSSNGLSAAQLGARAWPALRQVDVGGLGGPAIGAILSAAPALVSLVCNKRPRLWPVECTADAVGIRVLEAAARHAQLRCIDLSRTRLAQSVAATVLVLAASRTITWLALADCPDEEYVETIAPTDSPLRTLDLRYRGRVPPGLGTMLSALPALVSLQLSLQAPPDHATWTAIEQSSVRDLTVWGQPGDMPLLAGRPVTIRPSWRPSEVC